MSDAKSDLGFTDQQVCDQAKVNAVAGGLALLAYGRERGDSPETVAAWVGRTFAPGWDDMRGQGAREAMRWVALNLVSLGCALQSIAGDESRAEASVTGWPGEENLAFFGIAQSEADALFGFFGPVAERLGLRFAWRRDGELVTMSVERAGG